MIAGCASQLCRQGKGVLWELINHQGPHSIDLQSEISIDIFTAEIEGC